MVILDETLGQTNCNRSQFPLLICRNTPGFLRKVRLAPDPHVLDLQGEQWHLKSWSQSWRPI